jgi:hypothetical protein
MQAQFNVQVNWVQQTAFQQQSFQPPTRTNFVPQQPFGNPVFPHVAQPFHPVTVPPFMTPTRTTVHTQSVPQMHQVTTHTATSQIHHTPAMHRVTEDYALTHVHHTVMHPVHTVGIGHGPVYHAQPTLRSRITTEFKRLTSLHFTTREHRISNLRSETTTHRTDLLRHVTRVHEAPRPRESQPTLAQHRAPQPTIAQHRPAAPPRSTAQPDKPATSQRQVTREVPVVTVTVKMKASCSSCHNCRQNAPPTVVSGTPRAVFPAVLVQPRQPFLPALVQQPQPPLPLFVPQPPGNLLPPLLVQVPPPPTTATPRGPLFPSLVPPPPPPSLQGTVTPTAPSSTATVPVSLAPVLSAALPPELPALQGNVRPLPLVMETMNPARGGLKPAIAAESFRPDTILQPPELPALASALRPLPPACPVGAPGDGSADDPIPVPLVEVVLQTPPLPPMP